jgi:cystathionine beta-lyase
MSNATQLLQSIPIDPLTGAISVPIYQTSTFVQEAPGINKGYDYSRTNNPTRAILENIVAELENGKVAAAFASGLAAIDAVVKLLKSGDEIIAVDDIYGGAYRLFTQVYEQYGIAIKFVDASDPVNIFNAVCFNLYSIRFFKFPFLNSSNFLKIFILLIFSKASYQLD